jgi:hypothetical protein
MTCLVMLDDHGSTSFGEGDARVSLTRLDGAADWVRHQRLGFRMIWRLVPRRRLPVIVSAGRSVRGESARGSSCERHLIGTAVRPYCCCSFAGRHCVCSDGPVDSGVNHCSSNLHVTQGQRCRWRSDLLKAQLLLGLLASRSILSGLCRSVALGTSFCRVTLAARGQFKFAEKNRES